MTDILSLCTLRFQNGEAGKETEEDKDANKSEISVVFEIALKRNIPVSFEVCILYYLFAEKVPKNPTLKFNTVKNDTLHSCKL